MGGFCEKLLPSDRWSWSDVSGLQHRPLDGVALPSPHWEWESDWYVDENFGGEPTEKGVGELRTLHGCLSGSACSPVLPVGVQPLLGLDTLLPPSLPLSLHLPIPQKLPPPPPSQIRLEPWYFRGGHTLWTSLPPTLKTRNGIRACGGESGSGTGDTNPGTPGPRSFCLNGAWRWSIGSLIGGLQGLASSFIPQPGQKGTPYPPQDLAVGLFAATEPYSPTGPLIWELAI